MEINSIIKKAIENIRKETKEYVEEPEYSYKFNAKVLEIFELALDNDEITEIATNGFEDDLIDSYVDAFEKD